MEIMGVKINLKKNSAEICGKEENLVNLIAANVIEEHGCSKIDTIKDFSGGYLIKITF